MCSLELRVGSKDGGWDLALLFVGVVDVVEGEKLFRDIVCGFI